mmetsp:Transcript_10520/g.39118  ORF Transcript_10520/g.39118 Transcript_10520/m.39118 type:complete len:116 (+) Transcript_10520:1061-1408(+)
MHVSNYRAAYGTQCLRMAESALTEEGALDSPVGLLVIGLLLETQKTERPISLHFLKIFALCASMDLHKKSVSWEMRFGVLIHWLFFVIHMQLVSNSHFFDKENGRVALCTIHMKT